MKKFNDWKISAKVTALAFAASIPLSVVVLLYVLPTFEQTIVEQKIETTKHVVEIAYTLIVEYQARVDKGEFTVEEARQRAAKRLQNMRYNADDYFWVNDVSPKMIMHPLKPEMNGHDLSGYKDPNGKLLFVEMASIARTVGEGPVHYLWPKPGQDEPVRKVSYVKYFEPWGWIVGSGVYIDDVEGYVAQIQRSILATLLLSAVIAVLLGYFVGRIIRKPLERVVEQMEHADLHTQFNSRQQDEIGNLQRAFDQFVTKIRTVMEKVTEASVSVASATAEISSSTEQMAAGANAQTSQTGEVAGAVEEMSKAIVENSQTARITAETSKQAKKAAEQGGKAVDDTIFEMKKIAGVVKSSAQTVQALGKSSDQIGEIIGVIEEIADQTNLLALNAAIEAARAGDQGRGFAVVADEVRKLAERTTKATKEIAAMIKQIQAETKGAVASMETGTNEVDHGITLADKAGESLREIVAISQRVTDMITQIAAANEEQSKASELIAKNVESISIVTQETANGARKIAHTAEDLSTLTGNLEEIIGTFQLREFDALPQMGRPPRSLPHVHPERSTKAISENGQLIDGM